MKKRAFALLLLGFGAAMPAVAADAAAGAQLYQNGDPTRGILACMTCHGPAGNSVAPQWPKLASQHASYVTKQLQDFQAGARQDPTMAPMAAPLSPEDIQNVAAYVAEQSVAVGAANPEKAAAGKQLYLGGNTATGVSACMACHGPAGAGNPGAKFPSLSGQQAMYVTKALQDFRAGKRTNDLNGMMRDVAAKMTDTEIESVAEYISGLH